MRKLQKARFLFVKAIFTMLHRLYNMLGILYAGLLYEQHACFYSKLWPISWWFYRFLIIWWSPIQVFHFWSRKRYRSRQNNNITVNIKNHMLARDTKMIIARLSLIFRRNFNFNPFVFFSMHAVMQSESFFLIQK